MLEKTFFHMALIGGEWVLWVLLILSILSVAVMIERFFFYRKIHKQKRYFKSQLLSFLEKKELAQAKKILHQHAQKNPFDFETQVAKTALLSHQGSSIESMRTRMDSVLYGLKTKWDQNLTLLATIGSNAPFIGLFGTVLGIIEAFHHLSLQSQGGVTGITSGVSEALVATAVGLLVAIPAIIAFNLFSRHVKNCLLEAESFKRTLLGNPSWFPSLHTDPTSQSSS